MSQSSLTSTPRPVRLLRSALRALALASALLLALAVIGHFVRDRTATLAVLMYLPLTLLALFAIAAQAAAFERRRWKRRALLAGAAVLVGLLGVRWMSGEGFAASPAGATRIVHWNVQWGRDQQGWARTIDEIARAAPDLVILSEAPPDEKLSLLTARLGSGWDIAVARHVPGDRYWYAMAIASRWPIAVEGEWPLPNGAAFAVTIAAPRGPLRVLAVDGISDPMILRTPMLEAVADFSAAAAAAPAAAERRGEPIDIVAGDFNAVARSVGFDRLEARGYSLASRSCRGWRGTFPASLPVYDIDHVWLGRRHFAAACVMLDSPGTNHRGQLVYAKPRGP